MERFTTFCFFPEKQLLRFILYCSLLCLSCVFSDLCNFLSLQILSFISSSWFLGFKTWFSGFWESCRYHYLNKCGPRVLSCVLQLSLLSFFIFFGVSSFTLSGPKHVIPSPYICAFRLYSWQSSLCPVQDW